MSDIPEGYTDVTPTYPAAAASADGIPAGYQDTTPPNTVEELVVNGHRLGPDPNAAPQTAGGYFKSMAGNVIPSGWNLVQGIGHTIMHPVQTVETLGDVAGGVAQHGMNAVTGGNAPQVFDTKTADAVGHMYKDRYGGLSNIANTLKNDPIGVLADLSAPLTGGGGAIVAGADALGTAGRIGEVANVLRNVGKVAQVAGDVTNPLNVVTKPAGVVGAVAGKIGVPSVPTTVSHILGATTGTGSDALEGAFKAGQQGGENQAAFKNAISGKIPPQAIVASAAKNADDMSEMLRTHPGIAGWREDATHIPLTDVGKQFRENAIGSQPAGYNGPAVGVRPSDDAINSVGSILQKYDIPTLRTPQGLHTMIDELSNYRDGLPQNSLDYNLANKTIDSVTDAVKKEAPFYGKRLQTLQDARNAISDASQAVHNGRGVDASLMNLGNKISPLATDFGESRAMTSGNALKNILPHGAATKAFDLATSIGSGLLLGHGDPIHSVLSGVGESLFSSPRVVGSGANMLGQGSRVLNSTIVNPAVKAVGGTVMGTGRMNYTSPDGTITLQDYQKNQ